MSNVRMQFVQLAHISEKNLEPCFFEQLKRVYGYL